MTKKHFSAVIAALIPVLLLQACLSADIPDESPPQIESPPFSGSPPPETPAREPSEPGQFTIRYVPDNPVNPITSLNRDNTVLSSLLYECLFTLDGNLNVRPTLCESWSTEDNTTYSFVIKEGVAVTDGSTLTSNDVVYTIRQAMQTGRFVNRLKGIASVTATDDLTVTVVLTSVNNNFIKLLDIPIIKDGSIDDPIPPGTGPYVFASTGGMRLVPFPAHRDASNLTLSEIQLQECNDNELAELFDGGVLSLLWDDPSDTFDIILNRHNEPRYYDTTSLQYIGFNTRTFAFNNPNVRRAIGSSLNRSYIVSEIMPGQSLAAPLALSPAYRLYDPQWVQTSIDPLIEMSALFEFAGLKDFDNDSFLEYPDGYGGYYKLALDFIVNSENAYKVRTAYRIADTLRLYGIEIIVRELQWDNFTAALRSGNFDMYYGEVVLGADFDLSLLLLPGSPLNYGYTGSDYYKPFIEAFLGAWSDQEESIAAKALCDEINYTAPFIPILYKKYVVYTPIAAISGATPSQSGVFNGIAGWTIDLTMLS